PRLSPHPPARAGAVSRNPPAGNDLSELVPPRRGAGMAGTLRSLVSALRRRNRKREDAPPGHPFRRFPRQRVSRLAAPPLRRLHRRLLVSPFFLGLGNVPSP